MERAYHDVVFHILPNLVAAEYTSECQDVGDNRAACLAEEDRVNIDRGGMLDSRRLLKDL